MAVGGKETTAEEQKEGTADALNILLNAVTVIGRGLEASSSLFIILPVSARGNERMDVSW